MVKLDVVETVVESYKGAWSHSGDMVKLVWAPVFVYIVANVFQFLATQQTSLDNNPESLGEALQTSWGVETVIVTLIGMFLWPIIAVAWHRFILLGETSSSALYFRFGQREARFLLTSIFLLLLIVPGFVVIEVGRETDFETPSALLGMLLLIAGMVYAFRLSLMLPAIATDAPVDARAILEATQDNVLRIISVHFLSILALLVVIILVSIVLGFVALILGPVSMIIGGAVLGVFGQIISVAILSVMYRDLVLSTHAPSTDSGLH
jgi:hypothetical protein